ncbi:MAG: hypothetical protein HFF83_10800 [Oscillibacter sp.]|jgi:hypothetical protein|nr:hypothetical protein [Oscillibacter sp.]
MKRLHCGKKLNRFFHRCINGTKGVISLFLAILMVPFVSIAGALINAARVNSAIAVFDEALCNASNSTLGTYDEFLKSRFGLLAMAQNTAAGGSGYSVENLISETFQFYMEQNLGALSNTFFDVSTTAAGVYPLSDPDVLLTEVMEYSKYMVPTKMVIDGLSIDDWLEKLTEGTEKIQHIASGVSSVANAATSLDSCQDKLNTLKDKLEDCNNKLNAYTGKYNSFKSSVDTYNAKADEMKREVAKCDEKVRNAETALANADEDSYEAAKAALEAAKKERDDTIKRYHDALVPLRTAVSNNKSGYSTTLTELADEVKAAGEATIAAQKALDSAISSGAAVLKDVSTMVADSKKGSIDKEKKTLEEQKKAAQEKNDQKAVAALDQKIKDLEENAKKTEISNNETLINAGITAGSEAVSAMDFFARSDFQAPFSQLYQNIISLRNKVNSYTIVQQDERMENTGGYYQSFSLPVQPSNVENLLENLNQEVAKSSFFKVVKALVGFIKAMFTLNLWADPELRGNISGVVSKLPSHRPHSVSPYEEGDKAQSDYYKSIMGAYSSGALTAGSVSGFESTINALMDNIEIISDNMNGINWRNVLKRLANIGVAMGNIGMQLIALSGKMVQVINSAVYEKLLLAGYIGYNIPNRTTYTDSGLTGESYSLPSVIDGYSGAFNGAETEYVIMGSASEKTNQTMLFHIIYILRLLINIPTVLFNPEVETIATAAGAVTFGIGTAVVYFVYYLAEPLVDTLILVNGGDLPIVKTKVFLTPTGLADMIGEFYKLKMSDAQKEQVYQKLTGVVKGVDENAKFPSSYKDASKDTGFSSVLGGFTVDYTKTLILIMLFINTEAMLKRLGDVIQMEANYQSTKGRIDIYDFDLDKSYTYLRASGSFSTNEFIKLSDSGNLSSTRRVVYRGY